MTNNEAIKWLRKLRKDLSNPLYEWGCLWPYAQAIDEICGLLKEQPDVVRCKDCKNYMTIHCTCDGCCISDDWFCADGERR